MNYIEIYCEDCQEKLISQQEQREGGYSETIWICINCD